MVLKRIASFTARPARLKPFLVVINYLPHTVNCSSEQMSIWLHQGTMSIFLVLGDLEKSPKSPQSQWKIYTC